MRKLTVIQTLPALSTGGVERGTLEVAEELVKRGHRSIVVSSGGAMLKELIEKGSEHYDLAVGKKSLATLWHIPRLRKIMRETGATIVHARSRLPAWISYLAWKGMDPASRPRFITSVHGPYTVNRYSRIMTRGERVIAISDFIRDYITRNYPDVPTGKIIVIPRGVSRERYPYMFHPGKAWLASWHNQYPLLENKTFVTLPGRITRWKGQEDFLHILSRLPGDDNTIHGLIVGGPHPLKQHYFEELKALAKKLGLDHRLTFAGHRNDVREIMSISRIVMSLSNEPEAFGRTVLESLSLGVPVIAYAHGGAGEVMRTVFPEGLVPKNDTAAAAGLIAKFLIARPKVPEQNPFSLRRMLDSTMRLYEDVSEERADYKQILQA